MSEGFIAEAVRIVNKAKEKDIVLRIMGAVAIRIKCRDHIHLFKELRRELTDIDFAGYSRQGSKISLLLRELGYEMRRDMLIHEGRYFFRNPDTKLKIDIFLDELKMNHTVNFKNRLELEYPTITLADLVLEKLQIVNITEKDLKDLTVLLCSNEVGSCEKVINAKYIAEILSEDWGFYHTASINLEKLKKFVKNQSIPETYKKIVEERADKFWETVKKEPKSVKWNLRAKIGPKIKWYTDVEEAERQ
ncbi:MAG: hypothetical protein ACUVUF_07900 [Candidatus Bathycorpusculaceae bacterium]